MTTRGFTFKLVVCLCLGVWVWWGFGCFLGGGGVGWLFFGFWGQTEPKKITQKVTTFHRIGGGDHGNEKK